jgi:hypothetical protein
LMTLQFHNLGWQQIWIHLKQKLLAGCQKLQAKWEDNKVD